jgi:hypothetical protein
MLFALSGSCYVAIGVGFFVSFCSIFIATLNYIPSFIMNVMVSSSTTPAAISACLSICEFL